MKSILFLALAVCSVIFCVVWAMEVVRSRKASLPTVRDCVIGLVMLFFDTLGIGCFAPTTAVYKFWNIVPDEDIPGTLNIGITLPAVAEGFIFMSIVDVDIKTLVLMMTAASLGAWLGAGVVAGWPRRKIQIGLGVTLLVTAAFMLMTIFHLLPLGGNQLGLHGYKLAIGIVANLILGALMTLGIGFFAPCMVVVYLLGMSPIAAFPIMMGSVAYLGTIGSIRFIRKQRYCWKPAIGMTIGGVPGVLLAAYLVRSMPLGPLRWLVFVVIIYTAGMMLRSAIKERSRQLAQPAPGELEAQA
jgi:uncharacterized membrane protein YfcA